MLKRLDECIVYAFPHHNMAVAGRSCCAPCRKSRDLSHAHRKRRAQVCPYTVRAMLLARWQCCAQQGNRLLEQAIHSCRLRQAVSRQVCHLTSPVCRRKCLCRQVQAAAGARHGSHSLPGPASLADGLRTGLNPPLEAGTFMTRHCIDAVHGGIPPVSEGCRTASASLTAW